MRIYEDESFKVTFVPSRYGDYWRFDLMQPGKEAPEFSYVVTDYLPPEMVDKEYDEEDEYGTFLLSPALLDISSDTLSRFEDAWDRFCLYADRNIAQNLHPDFSFDFDYSTRSEKQYRLDIVRN